MTAARARAGRKSCAVTTAQRLGQFLGDERIQDKGLNCNYVIARRPEARRVASAACEFAVYVEALSCWRRSLCGRPGAALCGAGLVHGV